MILLKFLLFFVLMIFVLGLLGGLALLVGAVRLQGRLRQQMGQGPRRHGGGSPQQEATEEGGTLQKCPHCGIYAQADDKGRCLACGKPW